MAFPDTGILDDFNRGNEGPPPSGDWMNFLNGLKVDNNECIGIVDFDWNQAYWSSIFDSSCEAYVTISQICASGSAHLLVRFDPVTGSCYGAYFYLNVWFLYDENGAEVDSGAYTLNSGDGIGFRMVGLNYYIYHKPAAGVWTLLGAGTASPGSGPTGAGYLLLASSMIGMRMDDFGGGSLPIVIPDPAAVVAATALGDVVVVTERTTLEVVGTADGAAPHQVLNLREEDQQPAVLFVWRDEDGEGLDFSAATVHFRMRARMAAAGVFKVDAECIELGGGQVVWAPVAGDLDTPGEYYAYLVADYGGGVTRTSEMIVVRVWEAL